MATLRILENPGSRSLEKIGVADTGAKKLTDFILKLS
jgi:hypothetical protein